MSGAHADTGVLRGARWAVRCEDHTTTPTADRKSAKRLLAHIEEAGHCRNAHEVVEVRG